MTHFHRMTRLSVYLGNASVRQHRSVSAEIIRRAHRAGLRGASTLQGTTGFGSSGRIQGPAGWQLVDRTPITVHIIDSADRIRTFLPDLADFFDTCLIVMDEVDVATAEHG